MGWDDSCLALYIHSTKRVTHTLLLSCAHDDQGGEVGQSFLPCEDNTKSRNVILLAEWATDKHETGALARHQTECEGNARKEKRTKVKKTKTRLFFFLLLLYVQHPTPGVG